MPQPIQSLEESLAKAFRERINVLMEREIEVAVSQIRNRITSQLQNDAINLAPEIVRNLSIDGFGDIIIKIRPK
jgi:hypothetical protein